MNITSTVLFFGINLNWILFKLIISVHICLCGTLLTNMACSSSFTPLFITSTAHHITLSFKDRHNQTSFSLKHFSTIQRVLYSFIITLTLISPLATIISKLTSGDPIAFPNFIVCIAFTISAQGLLVFAWATKKAHGPKE